MVQVVVVGLVALISACVPSAPTGDDTVSTQLDLSGTVLSTSGDVVIPGAMVQLGIGATAPVVIDEVFADSLGRFALASVVQHQAGECGYWLGASANGYVTSDPVIGVVTVQCHSFAQDVQIRLDPE